MTNNFIKYLTLTLIGLSIFVHTNVKAQREIIISTDCAVDDLRS